MSKSQPKIYKKSNQKKLVTVLAKSDGNISPLSQDPRGRPRDYMPIFCEKVAPIMENGGSLVEVAAEIGIHRELLEAWRGKFPEFDLACKNGMALCQSWWEKTGRNSLRDSSFSSGLWNFNMKGRFGWGNTIEHAIDEKTLDIFNAMRDRYKSNPPSEISKDE